MGNGCCLSQRQKTKQKRNRNYQSTASGNTSQPIVVHHKHQKNVDDDTVRRKEVLREPVTTTVIKAQQSGSSQILEQLNYEPPKLQVPAEPPALSIRQIQLEGLVMKKMPSRQAAVTETVHPAMPSLPFQPPKIESRSVIVPDRTAIKEEREEEDSVADIVDSIKEPLPVSLDMTFSQEAGDPSRPDPKAKIDILSEVRMPRFPDTPLHVIKIPTFYYDH